jgi:hypothetical protein
MTMRRSGYTLLEVILATSIAVLLLGALYVAVDVQLNYAQAGRDRVEQNTLARSIFSRMSADAAQVVSLSDPARFRVTSSSSGSSGGSGGTSGNTGATGNTGSNTSGMTSGTGTSGTTSSSTDDGSSTTTTTNIVVPLGVQGDSTWLHMWVSKNPRENLTADQSASPPRVSDLWRVSWWLVGDAGSASGLARQEVKVVTSDDATNLPPGIDNEESFILASEVKSVLFEYFDGTNWNETWDSTEMGADGVTPKGSPVAIRVTMELARPDSPDQRKTYARVLVLPSANGTTTFQSVNQAPSGSSSSSSSGTTSGM